MVSVRTLSSSVRREQLGAWLWAPKRASRAWQELPGHPPPGRVAMDVRNEVTCGNLSSFQRRTDYLAGWNEVVGPVIRARRRA